MPRSRSSSSTEPPLLEVGRVDRPHGVRGEVAVRLITNRPDRLTPGTVLHFDERELVVRSSRPHQDRFLVRFAGVDDRAAADELRGAVLRAEPIDDPDELWVHDLIGADVVDQAGIRRGRVTGVLENPASDLLELADGTLVPVRFVVSVRSDGCVEVEVPAGLFEDDG